MTVTIYHNPRCSKSRQTLALIQEKGIEPNVIEYLNKPPTASALNQLLTMLDMEPEALMRKGEDLFKEHIQGKELSREQAIELMVKFPKVIERPIVVHGNRAAIGRPPESVLDIL